MSGSLEFPFADTVAKNYRAEAHLQGQGIQRLLLARHAQRPGERYLMALDWYQEADIESLRKQLGYRIRGLFELGVIARFDEDGIDPQRDLQRRSHWAMFEKLPEGDWLPRVFAGQPRSAKLAVNLGLSVGAALHGAADTGVLLTGLRPEYIWARAHSGGIEITGLSARGHTFFAQAKPRSGAPPLFERMYYALEVHKREPVDDRALTYTLALLVAEWATGQYPFPDAWLAGPKSSIATGAHAPLALPPKLESLLSRCLQPKVSVRPRLAELIDALRTVPTDEPARRL